MRDLKAFLRTGDPPHIMLIGSPGIGKNTLAYIFATEYLGRPITLDTENGDRDYKELNASKERGIETVREVIADFAETNSNTYKDGKLQKRIIFLDEFDSTTKAYQMALKSIMEKTEKNCIFILSMNEERGVLVPALFSRCKTFRLKRPNPRKIAIYFKEIALKEKVMFTSDELIVDIVKHYNGDMRKMMVDCLEPLRGYKLTVDNHYHDHTGDYRRISKEDLYQIYENDTKEIASVIWNNPEPRKKFMQLWEQENFNVRSFLLDLFKISGKQHPEVFAKVDSRLRRGCNEAIQMSYLFSQIL